MLDAPPREPRWLSWLYVVLASLVIFATVPFGRAIQNAVAGQMWLLYLAFAIAAALLFLLIRFLRQRRISQVGYFWLLSAGVAFAAYAYSLRGNPIETVHFVEYGLLSLLIYRALVHSVRDWSIHVTAVLIV